MKPGNFRFPILLPQHLSAIKHRPRQVEKLKTWDPLPSFPYFCPNIFLPNFLVVFLSPPAGKKAESTNSKPDLAEKFQGRNIETRSFLFPHFSAPTSFCLS
jgi:hypothetical protein